MSLSRILNDDPAPGPSTRPARLLSPRPLPASHVSKLDVISPHSPPLPGGMQRANVYPDSVGRMSHSPSFSRQRSPPMDTQSHHTHWSHPNDPNMYHAHSYQTAPPPEDQYYRSSKRRRAEEDRHPGPNVCALVYCNLVTFLTISLLVLCTTSQSTSRRHCSRRLSLELLHASQTAVCDGSRTATLY